MARNKKKKIDFSQDQGFNQTLGSAFGFEMPTESSTEHAAPQNESVESSPSLVIELKVARKGYGGKTVTECYGVDLVDDDERAKFVKSLTKAFGTRAFWKDDLLCVQGDHRSRLRTYLEKLNHTVRVI
ncbi:MAG: translation initiation factor [Bradymonadia bacterium]